MKHYRKKIDVFPTNSHKRHNVIKQLTLKYGFRCWYCGYRFEGLSEVCIDHIKPLSLSKDSNIENLSLSCRFCNSVKFCWDVEHFLRYLARIRTSQFECLILKDYSQNLDNLTKDVLSKSFY